MNIDNYLDIILIKDINTSNSSVDELFNPLIYNKMLDAVSCITRYKITIKDTENLYILNTYCFDIIKDIIIDSDISIIINNKEIKNLQNLTLPIVSLNSNIYIKFNNITEKDINISYKGYILNSIPRLEFINYYNKYKILNNYGLEFLKGYLNIV